jgi:ABC-type molybdate transport system, periplasmic component
MALVDAVPAGIYGKAALETLGIWDSVADSVAQADNVRAALALVGTGEAPLGIVYATDAAADPAVTTIGTFPEGSHPAIVYPAAALSDNAAASGFLTWLASPEAGEIFARHGFPSRGAEAWRTGSDPTSGGRLPSRSRSRSGPRSGLCPSASLPRICWRGASFRARRSSTG